MVVVVFHSPGVVDASTSSQAKDRLMMVSPTQTTVTGIKKYLGGMAVRAVAFHICTPDTPYYHLLQLLLTSVARASQKCTMLFHVGTYYIIFKIYVVFLIRCNSFRALPLPTIIV